MPQTIPLANPAAGGVRAFYFEDADRHDLELIRRSRRSRPAARAALSDLERAARAVALAQGLTVVSFPASAALFRAQRFSDAEYGTLFLPQVGFTVLGYVRELENLIERGDVLSSGQLLDLDPQLIGIATVGVSPLAQPTPRAESAEPVAGSHEADPDSLEEVERRHILAVLERTGWVLEGARGAAALLNLTPSTARSRMKRLGISRPARPR